MKKVELLAPAGSKESLIAAVQSGADAVYLGGDLFSARAYAANFNDEEMQKSIDYCHLYGVKVYITMNTLIKDKELDKALSYASRLYGFGADALIVQDTGFSNNISQSIPEFELHASTQMTIHNAEGALFLREKGFKRIVLSRELSLKEIEYISKKIGVETEIFIHGALCISYSGQCLMSSMIGGRSGNRGKCAQPCRMEYTLLNNKTKESKKAYILSPKDICTLENIKDVINTGTASLKIEGRMKRPEYVAGVVEAYRKAIDSAYTNTEFDFKNEYHKLLQLFNREGFSKAYFYKNTGKDMMALTFPKNTGILIGTIKNNKEIVLEEDLAVGDGIRIGKSDEGFAVSKIISGKTEIESAKKGDNITIIPAKYKSGDLLYKTSDVRLYKSLKVSHEREYEKKINLPLKVWFQPGKEIKISTIYNGQEFCAYGSVVETALNKPINKTKIEENLGKSSETAFKFHPIMIEKYESGFLSVSSINSVRRELINKIEQNLKLRREKINIKVSKPIELIEEKKLPQELIVVNSNEQLKAARESGFQDICLDISNRTLVYESDCYIKVPNILKEEFEAVCSIIEERLSDIKGIVTANLGIINRFGKRANIIGDYKLNSFNSQALNFYDEHLSGSCMSIELNKSEINTMLKNTKVPIQLLLYGKAELMISEYCPVGSIFGNKSERLNCKKECEKSSFILRDRIGEEFKIINDKYCRTHIYNSVPINLINEKDDLLRSGIKSLRIDFIDESYEEVLSVLKYYKKGNWPEEFKNYTRGHFKRGVE